MFVSQENCTILEGVLGPVPQMRILDEDQGAVVLLGCRQ